MGIALLAAAACAGTAQTVPSGVGELVEPEIGRRALKTDDVADRAELFGRLLATCAECHEWLGGGPPVTRVP